MKTDHRINKSNTFYDTKHNISVYGQTENPITTYKVPVPESGILVPESGISEYPIDNKSLPWMYRAMGVKYPAWMWKMFWKGISDFSGDNYEGIKMKILNELQSGKNTNIINSIMSSLIRAPFLPAILLRKLIR